MTARHRLALWAVLAAVLVVCWMAILLLQPGRSAARLPASQEARTGWIPVWMQSGNLAPASQEAVIEICELGRVATKDPDELPPAIQQMLSRPSTVFTNTAEALANAADPGQRATGLVLRSILATSSAQRAALGAPGCRDDMRCVRNAFDIAAVAGQSDRSALVRLADATDDPIAVAYAAQFCVRTNDCAGRHERWARADPDNAAAWLAVAQEAYTVGDGARGERALQRAADASRADNYMQRLFSPWNSDEMRRASSLEVMQAYVATPGLFGAWPVPLYSWLVSDQCGAAKLSYPQRRALCERIATLLAERDTSLIGQRTGEAIGKRVGWSQERHDRTRRLMDAYAILQSQSGGGDLDERRFSCGVLEVHRAYWADFAKGGEGEAMRRAIERSGTTLEALLGRRAALIEKELVRK